MAKLLILLSQNMETIVQGHTTANSIKLVVSQSQKRKEEPIRIVAVDYIVTNEVRARKKLVQNAKLRKLKVIR